jgi:hypothetical protein
MLMMIKGIQIKYIKKGSSIDLGDYFVNSSKEKDFNLIIGFWEKEKNNIVDVFNLFIEKDKWNKILYYDKSDELKEWIRYKVSNEYSYDEIWKEEIKEWKKDYGERKILLRFKRDHKTQRRIQCAINKKDFYDYFLKEFRFEQIRIR